MDAQERTDTYQQPELGHVAKTKSEDTLFDQLPAVAVDRYMQEQAMTITDEEIKAGKGYHSKSIPEVIYDLRDERFWRLANEVAKKGTRIDAANMLEKLCHELCDLRAREQS